MKKILLVTTLLIMTAACRMKQPEYITVCDKTETHQEMVPKSMAPGEFGISMGGMKIVTRTRCVESHKEPNPRYDPVLDGPRS